jgi:hypothetical protein
VKTGSWLASTWRLFGVISDEGIRVAVATKTYG